MDNHFHEHILNIQFHRFQQLKNKYRHSKDIHFHEQILNILFDHIQLPDHNNNHLIYIYVNILNILNVHSQLHNEHSFFYNNQHNHFLKYIFHRILILNIEKETSFIYIIIFLYVKIKTQILYYHNSDTPSDTPPHIISEYTQAKQKCTKMVQNDKTIH